jgi:hypothetical protein
MLTETRWERALKRFVANTYYVRSMLDTCMWQLEHEIRLSEDQRSKILCAADSLVQQFNDVWAAFAK